MILLIDNYDSFTYNIVQYLQMIGGIVHVIPNDSEKIDFNPTHIVIGPGPGYPSDSGISKSIMLKYLKKTPILGVCLGHQCIGELFGARIMRAKNAIHGKVSQIRHDGKGLFQEIDQPFLATRYHSLVVEKKNLPNELIVTAETDGEIMGLRHKHYMLEGVQFHPESVSTEHGLKIFENFINLTGESIRC